MASLIYDKYVDASHTGGSNTDLLTGNIKALLIDTNDYTVNGGTDEFKDDIPSAAIIATSGNLASKTFSGGVFDAADVTFSSVTGDAGEAVVVYVDTGTDSTSRLVNYIDGLTFTPDGNDITCTWNASGIAQF